MKVKRLEETNKERFGCLRSGDVFEECEQLWMKTDTNNLAVRLYDGMMSDFRDDFLVAPTGGTFVEGGKECESEE